jgi:hypothetical protein
MKDVAKLTFAEMVALTPAERIEIMASGVALVERIATQQETSRKIRPAYAKLVAAMKRDHTALLDEKKLPRDTSFRKYFGDVCKGDLSGRLDALSTLFNALCLCVHGPKGNEKPLLPEEMYDAHSTNSLEIANACINHVKTIASESWIGHNDTLDVLNALSKPGDATAKLKEIRARQKGVTKKDAGPVEITTEQALAHLLAAIAAAKDMKQEIAADLFTDTVTKITEAWKTSGISDDLMNMWSENAAKGISPDIELKTGDEKPAEEKPAEKHAKKSAAKVLAAA